MPTIPARGLRAITLLAAGAALAAGVAANVVAPVAPAHAASTLRQLAQARGVHIGSALAVHP